MKAAEAHAAQLRAKHQDLLDDSVVFSKLLFATDLITRAKLREEIRRKVAKISIKFHLPIATNDDTAAVIEFVNGVERALVFTSDRQILAGDLDDPGSWVELKLKRVPRPSKAP